MSASVVIHTVSAGATRRIGQVIGQAARAGDVYLLTGPLGAGKTCLTQGIARGLGAAGYARSPTFVLVTRYQGRLAIHHADLYRIEQAAEAWDLGLEDIIAAGEDVLIVEWADRAAAIFPDDALWIELDYAEEGDPAAGASGTDTLPDTDTVPDDDDGSVPARHRIAIANAPSRFAHLMELLGREQAVAGD